VCPKHELQWKRNNPHDGDSDQDKGVAFGRCLHCIEMIDARNDTGGRQEADIAENTLGTNSRAMEHVAQCGY
jgi:hypothetical protein